MFPISDSINTHKFPLFNILIIAVTAFVFIQQIISPNPDAFVRHYALIPSLINVNNPVTLLPFVTAIFLHGGWLHILSNMWFLWVFGDDVEGALGNLKFAFLYFISGIIGNIVQYSLMPASTIPILGASGAIAGILGAYFIMFPYSKIKTLVFFFFFVTIINISAPIMLGYWFVLQLISGIGDLAVTTQQGGVAFWAHVGGFISGIIAAKVTGGQRAIEGEVIDRNIWQR